MGSGIGSRLKRNKVGLVGSVAAVAALAATSMFTLGGFSASIQNNTSTFSSATVAFSEVSGGTTCYNTGSSPGTVSNSNTNTTCTINMLNGALDQIPGGTALTQSATVSNTGDHTPSTASLVIGSCTAAAASDANSYVGADTASYCAHVDVTIFNNTTGKCMYPYSASVAACPALSNTYNLSTVAGDTFNVGAGTPSGTTQYGLSIPTSGGVQYTVTDQLDSSAAVNGDQGLTATMPFTWSISQ
jgi:hypothetical protein